MLACASLQALPISKQAILQLDFPPAPNHPLDSNAQPASCSLFFKFLVLFSKLSGRDPLQQNVSPPLNAFAQCPDLLQQRSAPNSCDLNFTPPSLPLLFPSQPPRHHAPPFNPNPCDKDAVLHTSQASNLFMQSATLLSPYHPSLCCSNGCPPLPCITHSSSGQ